MNIGRKEQLIVGIIAGSRLKRSFFLDFSIISGFSPNRFQDSVDFLNLISSGIGSQRIGP
jgi:hypothetical protein